MTQTSNINNTYGNSITVAVANTYMKNVIESSYLPKSALLIATEYANGEDVGHASLLVTDYTGKAAKLSSYIIEGNGLHSTNDAVYLSIDNNTIKETNGKLAIDVENIIDSSSFYTSNESISLDTQSLAKASNTTYGVAKVDNMTIKSNDGTIFVNTEGLDLANGQFQSGIARGDNSTISTTQGVLQAITSGLEKASNNTYGVAKVDGNIIKSNDGTIYVDKSYLKNITKDNKRLYVGDNQTIMSTDGVLSFNEQSLPIASNSQVGVVKIDPNTIEINQDQSISIKGIDETFAYVYDYEAGMDEIESKISYIRTTLDSGNLTGAEPEIRHLTCNQTTTSILAKPEYLEEPINMEIQHVYVSLNVITNCKFVVEVIYDNNVVPNVELESINYNDEFTISGVDCLENVWPSTGMKEKTIVLLFNSKNFFSTTGLKTDVTKLSISVTSYDDNTKTKKVIYSIIRYNSFYRDDDMKDEPEQEFIEYSAEYVVDEKNSEWYIINVDEDDEDSWDKNVISFDKTASYVKKHGNLGGQDMVSTITVDNIEMIRRANEDEEHHKLELYLYGVYIEKKTGKSYSFLKPIPFDKFDTMTVESNEIYTLKGRGVYDYPFKVKFDTLYFQIRYQVDKKTRSILLGNTRDTVYTYHDGKTSAYIYVRNNAEISPYYVSIDNGNKSWSTCNAYAFDDIHEVTPNHQYIQNTFLLLEPLQPNRTGSDTTAIVATPTIDDNNDVIYEHDGITYATIHIDDCLNFNSFGSEDKKNTKLVIDTDFDNFDIGKATMVFVNPDVIIDFDQSFDQSNLTSLENENIVTCFDINVKNMRYDTCTYLYCGEEHLNYFTYGQEMPDICYYSSLLYSANYENFRTVPRTNNEDLSYMMINLVNGETKLYDNTFKPINGSYVINGNYDNIANQPQYKYSISYNFSYNTDEKYWETDKANELVINTYSYPRILLSGLSIDLDNKIQIKKDDDINIFVNNVERIQNRNPYYTSYFAYYILLSYMANSSAQIQELNPISLIDNDTTIQIDSNYLSQDYRLKIGQVTLNTANILDDIQLNNHGTNINIQDLLPTNYYFNHIFAYVSKANDTAFSNVITLFKCEQPHQNYNLVKLSYNYFDCSNYQEDKIYSYYTINELENYQTCFSDNSYIRPNTYVTLENDVKCILSYDPHPIEHDIVNISMLYGEIIVDINDHGYENHNIGYADNGSFALKIGNVYNGDENELQSCVSAYIMTYFGNVTEGNFKEYQLAINKVDGDIIAHGVVVESLEPALEIFLNINTLPKYYDLAYNVFNSAVWRLNCIEEGDDKFLVINNNNYYDYLLTYVYATMNDAELDNLYLNTNENYYLKLYDNEDNCMTFQLDGSHNILVNGENIINLDQDHYVCQAMLSYQNNNQEYSSGSLGYTYNVPNLFNMYNECSIEVYSDFIVPRFNKQFNSYFTPYDFSVEANIPGDETNYLNKKVELETPYVTFNMKYKGNVFKSYVIDTDDLNVDLPNVTYIQKGINTSNDIVSYAYVSYSPTYPYAYGQIQSYIDTSIIHLYDDVIEQKEYYCKLSAIDDLDINDSIDVIGENEQFSDVNIYLFNPNTMGWKLNGFNNVDNVTVYEFNLVKTSNIDYEQDIYPQLNPNYPIILDDTIENILGNNNYDLEDSDPIGSGSSN